MKKILTLLLFLTAMVGTANAANVTRRFVAINQVGWSNVYIYMSYDNNETETAISNGWPGTQMTYWSAENNDNWKSIWYVDLNIPEGVSNVKVTFNNGSSSGKNQTWDYNNLDISSEDKLFYIYEDNSSSNHGISPVEMEYYLCGWDSQNGSAQKFTFNPDGSYTCTLDGTSFADTQLRAIFPMFSRGGSGSDNWVSWSWPIRPNNRVDVSFSNYTGNTSLNSGQCWYFEEAVYYNVTFNLPLGTWSIEPYFTRTLPAAAEGYATFSSEYDVTVPTGDGLSAKYAVSVTNSTINWSEDLATIKGGQGALLHGTAGRQYTFTPATDVPTPDANLLQPIILQSMIPQTNLSGYTNYILAKQTTNGAAELGFYKVNSQSSSCAAGTAYLQVPNSQLSAQGANVFFPLFGEDVTGINAVNMTNDNQTVYDLQGRRVANPTRGLYIVNGHKVVIK